MQVIVLRRILLHAHRYFSVQLLEQLALLAFLEEKSSKLNGNEERGDFGGVVQVVQVIENPKKIRPLFILQKLTRYSLIKYKCHTISDTVHSTVQYSSTSRKHPYVPD
jgi:hypothetical protein